MTGIIVLSDCGSALSTLLQPQFLPEDFQSENVPHDPRKMKKDIE
jgi:hypothetical protein